MTKEIYVDGACSGNPGDMRIAVLITDKYSVVEGAGYGTNNQAEYLALIHALDIARTFEEGIIIKSDSLLMVRQMNGAYKVKSAMLRQLHEKAMFLLQQNHQNHPLSIEWLPREQNLAGHMLE